MYRRLLLEKLEEIGPDAKFFLLKFLQSYWEEQVVSVSNKELLESFGIYDKSVKSVLKDLQDNEYLALEKRLTGAKGRPKQALARGKALQKLVLKWATADTVIQHELSIEKLLEVTAEREQIVNVHWGSSLSGRNTRKPAASRVLTNTRKLLLCILLAKADQFGVIRDLGMVELASLAGLSKEQLRWHLKILKGSQFLLGYIPGKSIKGVRGKLKSSFVLRLGQFAEGEQPVNQGLLIQSAALKLFKRAVHLAKALYVVNEHIGRKGFAQRCISQFDHWSSIYGVSKEELTDLLASIDFLLKIKDVDDSDYRRICEFVCELTAILFKEGGLTGLLSSEQVVEKISLEVKKRGLSITGVRSGRVRSFVFLSRLVWMLYREILKFVGVATPEGNPYRISSCLIDPQMSDGTVLVYLSVDLVHKRIELST